MTIPNLFSQGKKTGSDGSLVECQIARAPYTPLVPLVQFEFGIPGLDPRDGGWEHKKREPSGSLFSARIVVYYTISTSSLKICRSRTPV